MFGRRKIKPDATEAANASSEPPRIAPRSPSEVIKPAMAPPPPIRVRKPRGGLLSTLSGIFSFFAVVALGLLLAFIVIAQQASAPGPLSSDRVVVVPRNTGTSQIAEILAREGVIDKPLLFQLTTVINQQRGQLKAGEFVFRANTSISEAINILSEGRALLHSVTIPEGRTSYQIVEILRANEILSGEVAEVPPEGSLLPDTYKFERGMTRQQIIETMTQAQRTTLQRIWDRRMPDLPFETPEELVILASIVERETGRADERPRVAGVFINRLRQNMRLQSDPTIVYGLVGGQGTLGRGIRRSEITQPTDYNTYVINGLPPGPIANPGRAAMEAVANPSRTSDLFFVADGTGGHAFSETYEQHRRNVARWRQIESERGAAQPDQVDPGDAEAADQRGDLLDPSAPINFGATAATGALVRDASLVGRQLDVSEGTALDPLRNTTFSLDSPQMVPDIEPLPGEEGATPARAAGTARLTAPDFLPPRPERAAAPQ